MIVDYVQKKNLNFKEIELILKPSIESNHWTNNGQVKQELEQYLNKFLRLNTDKCTIAVSSATAGLHLLMMYYEYIKGTHFKWVSPSFTFPSVAVNNPNNLTILDIDKETYTLPLNKDIYNFDGFIITNLFGTYVKNIDEWVTFCKEYDKILIFDNAASPLSSKNDTNICNFGNASIISFHPTKYLGAQCEAGAIIVNKEEYDIINSFTNFGFNNSRKYNKFSSNFKLDDLRASCLISHLKNYDLEKHIYNQNNLIYEIEQLKNVKVFNFRNEGEILGNLCLEFDKPIDNKEFMDLGLMCHKYYLPLDENHKNSMDLYNKMINMPLNSGLTEFQVEFIINQIKHKCK